MTNVSPPDAQAPSIDRWCETLLREGYCIIPEALPAARIAALDTDLASIFAATPFCQGKFYGEHTKRFGALPRRSLYAHDLVLHPMILRLATAVLGSACDRIQLNVAQAIEIHPGAPRQFPHRDEDMWQGAKGDHEYLLNVMWPLTPFTSENGATLIYPRSHNHAGASRNDVDVPISAVGGPGTAICFLGSTAHGAGANTTGLPRRGVVIGYSLGWLKPYENPWLAYPPAIARTFPRALSELAGYAQHRPNLGNYEGQCPSILLGERVPKHLAAIDCLRPDQAELLSLFDDMAPAVP